MQRRIDDRGGHWSETTIDFEKNHGDGRYIVAVAGERVRMTAEEALALAKNIRRVLKICGDLPRRAKAVV